MLWFASGIFKIQSRMTDHNDHLQQTAEAETIMMMFRKDEAEVAGLPHGPEDPFSTMAQHLNFHYIVPGLSISASACIKILLYSSVK